MSTAAAVKYFTFIAIIQINTLLSYAEDSTSPANVNASVTNMTELEILKKEKEDLLESLIEAVEDTKGYISQNNITTSLTNLTNIKELFANYLSNSTQHSEATLHQPSIDRRQLQHLSSSGHNYSQYFQLVNAAKNKHKKSEKRNKNRELQRVIMQGKIDEWLLNRELEKKKIKKYASQLQTKLWLEKCPREGMSKKKKRKKFRRVGESSADERKRQKEERRKARKAKRKRGQKKYPCCRKCCKRSYMGCL